MIKTKTDKKTVKNVGQINFIREKGNQVLFIKTTKTVEDLFKSKDIEVSEKYKDLQGNFLKFYKLSDRLKDFTTNYNNITSNKIILDRYGSIFELDNYKVNVSLLRTVNISKGIYLDVKELVSDDNIQRYSEYLAKFLKYLYQNFVQKTIIKATINLEI
jgi:hypothetical protein